MHVEAMTNYALRICEQSNYFNEHSFNDFKIRIGINIEPIVAGLSVQKSHSMTSGEMLSMLLAGWTQQALLEKYRWENTRFSDIQKDKILPQQIVTLKNSAYYKN